MAKVHAIRVRPVFRTQRSLAPPSPRRANVGAWVGGLVSGCLVVTFDQGAAPDRGEHRSRAENCPEQQPVRAWPDDFRAPIEHVDLQVQVAADQYIYSRAAPEPS